MATTFFSVGAIPAQAVGQNPWPSGINGNFGSEAKEWADFRGSPVGVMNVFVTPDQGWDSMVNPGDYVKENLNTGTPWRGMLVVSAPMWPTNYVDRTPAQHLEKCAKGAYSWQWSRFGKFLAHSGQPQTVARIGWEFDGFWFPWSAVGQNYETWKQCYRNIADAIRSESPDTRMDWSVNRLVDDVDPFDVYPGDPWVDIVSVNSYDQWPASTTHEAWSAQFNAPGGVGEVIRFAIKHGKAYAVPEWGLSGRPYFGGGDNPFFIEQMYRLFALIPPAYEVYHGDARPGEVLSAIYNPTLHPRASATYARLF